MSYTIHRWRELGVLGQRVRLYSLYWAESEGGRCCFCGYPVTIFKSVFWDRSLKVRLLPWPISSLISSAPVRYPSITLLLCINRDAIFLRYCIVMPLWFISAWLSSCVLCCKSVGAQLFYDGANDAGFFFILTFSSAGLGFVLRLRRNLYDRFPRLRQPYVLLVLLVSFWVPVSY